MKRRAARPSITAEAAALLRSAFEPRYGRKLDDGELEGMADRMRRFTAIVVGMDAEDRARAALADAEVALPPASNVPPRAAK